MVSAKTAPTAMPRRAVQGACGMENSKAMLASAPATAPINVRRVHRFMEPQLAKIHWTLIFVASARVFFRMSRAERTVPRLQRPAQLRSSREKWARFEWYGLRGLSRTDA